jgi:phosphoribosylaminoimidazolecarboxamide formyltransferase/IMP cyclohydrolase
MLQHLVEIYNQKTIFAIYNNNYIMNTTKTIQSALISVFSKKGLEPIVRKLHSQNVVLYSTGGTEDFIKN